ncbi:MAG TPA: thylakoid-associated protein [Richelia sp.]|nr:thylakoid-associated protein [Richelia sp.]
MQTQKPFVSLIQAYSYEREALRESIKTLLEPLGGLTEFVKPGQRVLLKPNLLTGARPTKECTTHPEIVYVVAQMVMEINGKPFLGDSPAFGSAKKVAIANGYQPIFNELNIPIINFQGKRYQTINENFKQLLLSKEAIEADVVINLPKVKSHVQLVLTLGTKNLFGCVPGKMKAWWHMQAGKNPDLFGEMLVETAKAINPNLTIIDGIVGHEGNGPSGGEPRNLNILGASADVFALDMTFANILSVAPKNIPTVAASLRLGLIEDLMVINFPLLHPETLKVDNWQLPKEFVPIDFGLPRVIKSTFRHLYIRFIKESMNSYGGG